MQVVIIRPPLIYGPGVKGNFRSIIKIIEKGLPLPFGAVHNQRSLVALDNLTDLIIICLEHPNAADQIFLAGDGQDLSSTELFREISNIMGKNLYLLPIPLILMQLVAKLLNKDELLSRLTGDLQVDISKSQIILNWTPPISVSEGLRRCLLKE
jgi:nucleoside-diphosphate-sugar epimerase